MVTVSEEWYYQKLLGPYTCWNQYFTTLENFWVSSEKGDTWGDLSAPEATSDRRFIYFLSYLIKYSENFRIKNSQNHFNITFGSAYFISKNDEIKLAKPMKRNQGKQAFLGILTWCFCIQLKCTDISEYLNLSQWKEI